MVPKCKKVTRRHSLIKLVLVLGTAHVKETAERSRRMSSLTKLQLSTRYEVPSRSVP